MIYHLRVFDLNVLYIRSIDDQYTCPCNEYHGDLLAIGCRGLLTRLRGLGVFVFPWRSAIICGLPRAAATDRLFGRLDASCASMIREPGWSIDRLYLLWWRREEREAVAWEINLMILLWWLTLTRTVSAHSRRASSLNLANYAFLTEDAAQHRANT